MTTSKPKIVALQWFNGLLAIDWENLRRAFEITVEHSDAKIFRQVIWFGIDPSQIINFALRTDAETSLAEIVLDLRYKSGETKESSLGLTSETALAQKWVNDANAIVQNYRTKKSQIGPEVE